MSLVLVVSMFSQILRSGEDGVRRERESSNSKLVSSFRAQAPKRAQGTIEYLVIIGIVVVISLVVVGLLMTQMESGSSVGKSSSKLGGLTQSIGITESLVSPTDQNFVVKLLNNSGSTITVSNVKIGDRNVNFSEDLAQSGSKLFKVNTSEVCELGKVVSQEVVITYVTSEGLTKTEIYPAEVMFDCTPYNIAQANLANQCPSSSGITPDGNATASQVLSGYSFYGNGLTKLNGSLKKYANLGSGQTGCWDVDGTSISCSDASYPGMDGNVYGAGYAHVWSSTANTMLDLNTNLRWQKADNGSTVTWQNALQYCSNLSLDGYASGWRLPTLNEISGMYNYQSGSCITGFSSCNIYWSSTSVPSYPVDAYLLNTDYGFIVYDYKDTVNYIRARCVRFES
jgi:hypothetical protein